MCSFSGCSHGLSRLAEAAQLQPRQGHFSLLKVQPVGYLFVFSNDAEQRRSAGSDRLCCRCLVQSGRGRNRQSCGGRHGGAAAGDVSARERDQEAEEQHRGPAHRAEVSAGEGEPAS